MNTATIITLVIAIVALAAVFYLALDIRKTRNVKAKFGPEYDRVVSQEGTPRHAVAVLKEREKRVEQYHIRALTPDESMRFAAKWRSLQEQFVDDPSKAVWAADQLVNDALKAKGYPMTDFEHQAADLSVNHPRVVDEFRMGHGITMASQQGHCSTEELRLAMQHYRNIFEEISNINIGQEVSR